MAFQKVQRKKSRLRMALVGVSGAGKTLGALYIAAGMSGGDWSKVALIDTEHGRAQFYADRSDLQVGEFLYSELTPPYSPTRYIEAAKEGAAAVGEDGVLIIDSMSHAWNAEGGVLDIKEQIARSGKAGMNDYTAWKEAGKEQGSLVNEIFTLPCHVIVTMRVKTEYALEVNERGKQQPVKLGLTPIQRADMEYEFDTVLSINREHIATASKDVTFLDRFGQVITPELGAQIAAWLGEGIEPIKCACCGRTISPSGGKSVEQIVDGSMKFAGRAMCLECFGRWFKLGKGRTAQLEKIYSNIGGEPSSRELWVDGILSMVGVEPINGKRCSADASEEQWQQALKEARGE